ncbi:MAG TPA: hypothetical protein VK476_06720, partial [Flavobacterium sp.]|nr:hypothetical protein [Flavobacterium sp.]
LFMVILIGVGLAAFSMIWGFGSMTETMAGFNVTNFSAVGTVIYILVTSLFGGLTAPFTAGIIKMSHCAATKQDFSIGTAFDYYKSPYFKEIFIAAVIIALFTNGANVGLQQLDLPFVAIIPSCIIALLCILTIPLIIFGQLTAVEAIQASAMLVSKQIFPIIGLLIVSLIIACLGLIGFCIGMFFTIPFLYACYYCIYDEIIGAEFKSELDEIGEVAD